MFMANIIIRPNTLEKLDKLAASAKYDVCMSSCNANPLGGRGRVPDPVDPLHKWVYPLHNPSGGTVPVLKILQTNSCSNSCSYCKFSAKADEVERVGLASSELAALFMEMNSRRLVEGLFLSSGIGQRCNGAMERMVRTADILRNKYKFKGYIHLKILPGSSYDLVEKATDLATRVSVNLEAPSKLHLSDIAPDKRFAQDLITRMKWAGERIKNGAATNSQTTQFVVGAAEETDLDILRAADWIYRELFVFRSYYSAFQETGDILKEQKRRSTLLREHRLYQSDYLLRGYGFRMPDLVFDSAGGLPDKIDPKAAYAMMHPELFPCDINCAEEEQLLRVPGIGPLSARRIVNLRVSQPFHTIEELRGVGAVASKAAPYVEFSGKSVSQLRLFETPPPSDWETGILPSGIKVEHTGSEPYTYPAQIDRPLYYSGTKGEKPVLCR